MYVRYTPRLISPWLLLLVAGPMATGEEIHLSDCVVSLKEQILVPARQAGVLVSLNVQEGSRTTAGGSIGLIDDAAQRLEHELSKVQQMESAERAANDIEVRYARSAALVATAELEAAQMANQRVGGSLPLSEVRRLELSASRAKLLVEKSQTEQRIAALTLRARDVAVAIAEQNAARCQIVSSIDGEVIELQKQPGEWVSPGEPIAHIVRLDTLRVEGFVSAAEHSPSELADQPVVATVRLARGETAEFAGRIAFVRPVVQGGGQFLVYAEVANRSQNGHWLLQPGMVAQMTIGASRNVESTGRLSAASMIPRAMRDAK